jgi:hypothetical protein
MSAKRASNGLVVVALLLLHRGAAHAQVMQTAAIYGPNGLITFFTAPAGTPLPGQPMAPAVHNAQTMALVFSMNLYFSAAYPPDPPRWDVWPLSSTADRSWSRRGRRR